MPQHEELSLGDGPNSFGRIGGGGGGRKETRRRQTLLVGCIASLHGVRLASSRVPVGEDAHILALEAGRQEGGNLPLEEVLLLCVTVVAGIEAAKRQLSRWTYSGRRGQGSPLLVDQILKTILWIDDVEGLVVLHLETGSFRLTIQARPNTHNHSDFSLLLLQHPDSLGIHFKKMLGRKGGGRKREGKEEEEKVAVEEKCNGFFFFFFSFFRFFFFFFFFSFKKSVVPFIQEKPGEEKRNGDHDSVPVIPD